jgi:cbb3-type cytochrome oxidase maturation protein
VSVAIGFLIAFIWAVRNGQYEDDYSPAVRILFEEERPASPEETTELTPAAENPIINS